MPCFEVCFGQRSQSGSDVKYEAYCTKVVVSVHAHTCKCIYYEHYWEGMGTNVSKFSSIHYTIVRLPPHLTIERVCYSPPVLLPVSPSFTPSHRRAVLVEISEIAQVCCAVCSDELWRHAQHECRLPREKCVYIHVHVAQAISVLNACLCAWYFGNPTYMWTLCVCVSCVWLCELSVTTIILSLL